MLLAARAARDAGRVDEARSMLLAAAQRFPEFAQPRHDLARLAEADQNWPEAERWWREFTALSPTVWWAVTQTAQVIRLQGRLAEADALVADALDRFPDEVPLYAEHARTAEMRRDWAEAAARWTTVADRFPDSWEGTTGQARVLREQGQPEQARALLLYAAERFPTATEPVRELAVLAERRRDWPTAEKWWRAFLANDPAPWRAYTGLAIALAEQQRIDEAEQVLAAQLERLAGEVWVFIEYAKLAERARQWTDAAQRYDLVISRFPRFHQGYAGLARALRGQDRLDEALTVLLRAIEQFPAEPGLLHDLARLSEARQDWPEAERYWLAFLATDPGQWWAYASLAFALQEQQRIDEAEDVLTSQFERFAGDPTIFNQYALLAERRADWALALQRWESVASRFPNAFDGFGGQARALRGLGRLDEARSILAPAIERFPSEPSLHAEMAHLEAASRPAEP